MTEEQIIRLSKHEDPEVRELVEAYKVYLIDPAAEFYTALVQGAKFLSAQVRNKKLDMDDPYTKGVTILLEKGDKISNSIQRGKLEANPSGKEDEDNTKRVGKSQAVAI
jgi:hypothetical protein